MAIHSKQGTLVANTVATIALSGYAANVRIINLDAASPIYYRTDGVNPTIGGGDEIYVVPPKQERVVGIPSPNNPEIRLISATAADYSVEGV